MSLASWKGGAGKTTTAVHLAEGLSVDFGEGSVLLIPTNPRGSAIDWAEKAQAGGRPLRSRVVHWPDPRKVATLRAVREPLVVVDTPNRDEAVVRAASPYPASARTPDSIHIRRSRAASASWPGMGFTSCMTATPTRWTIRLSPELSLSTWHGSPPSQRSADPASKSTSLDPGRRNWTC
jgi:hypothetical protein